jgi:response regulator RpfG family c-di-GMP phosphodiesterase
MPDIDGIEFLDAARKRRPEARRLLVTGYADFETALVAINKVGVDRLLTKPWNPYEMLSAVQGASEHAALLRDNARIHEELRLKARELSRLNKHLDHLLEERTSNLLDSLVSALDLRDSETQWHSRRVGLYSRRLAIEMGIAARELDDIERGSILHDIGKIGVRDAVLLKPGPLTEEEWVEMRRHPSLGFEMLKDIGFLEKARLIPLQHQERWDGLGYPAGLRGEAIHIGARIFSVVDATTRSQAIGHIVRPALTAWQEARSSAAWARSSIRRWFRLGCGFRKRIGTPFDGRWKNVEPQTKLI